MSDRADTGTTRTIHHMANASRRALRLLRRGLACTALGLAMPLLPVAQAQDAGAPDSPQGYQADRALCISGLSHQEREDCLREAGAARQAARRGELRDDEAQYRRNALKRCEALPAQAREDCIARMLGEGTTIEGSVEEGGIYRERREFMPPPVPPARPPAAGGVAD